YGKHPSDIPKIWEGGLAIYGGLIAGIIAAYVVCRVRKMNFFNLLDCCCISFLVGQGIGRWGNFFNQEAFGTNTDLPWGMKSEKTVDYLVRNLSSITEKGISVDPSQPVHPTFLYESLWCLLGVLVLYLVCRKFRLFSGQMALWYGVWYGVERAVVEGLRTDSLYLGNTNIRTSQLVSAVLAAACLVLLIVFTVKYKKNPKPIDGIDFFTDNANSKKEPEKPAEITENGME
ncbi:MAG: prolipoprotein diacylglyceryl transferase, partial [Clostridia bacterium]|nr:prolipoprotein diacylglyceryl transferase [Clostridia bacterium]